LSLYGQVAIPVLPIGDDRFNEGVSIARVKRPPRIVHHTDVRPARRPKERKVDVESDIEALTKLNIRIGEAESIGDASVLEAVLAPKLAFRRADLKTFDDRTEFMKKVAPGDPRETLIQSIDVNGSAAFVRCIVTVKAAGGDKAYRNLRLFVRDPGGWTLLGWANEPV